MDKELAQIATRQGGVFTKRQARASGYGDERIRHLVESGRWTRLRRGSFTGTDTVTEAAAVAPVADCRRLGLEAWAVLVHLPPGTRVSHETAVRLWRWEMLSPPAEQIHVTVPGGVRTPRLAGVVTHVGPVDDAWFRPWGVPSTGRARTVVDLARSLDFRQAVVIADSALRAGNVRPADLRVALGSWRGRPHAAAAQRVVDFTDARAESVLESLARVLWHQAGIAAPELQWEVRRDGRFVARVDFAWPAQRLAVEVDGLGKYDEPGAIGREKRRDVALSDAGWRIRHFTWADIVGRPDYVITAVRRALAETA